MKALRLRDDRPAVRTDNRRRRHVARYEREPVLRTALRRIRNAPAALVRAGDRVVEAVLDPSPAMNRGLWLLLMFLAAYVVGVVLHAAVTLPRETRPLERPWHFGGAEVVAERYRLADADSRPVTVRFRSRVFGAPRCSVEQSTTAELYHRTQEATA